MHARAPVPAPASRRTPAAAAVLGVLVMVLLCFPGGMSSDSIAQLAQARSGLYTTWHPPVMAYAWGLVEHVAPGPFGMLVLQALAWWGGLALIARRAFDDAAGWRAALVIGFWPPFLGMVGNVWKDVQLAVALTLAVGLVAAASGRRARWMLVAALVAIAYGTAMRHNGAFAGLPLAAWAAWKLVEAVGPRARRVLAAGAITFVTLGAPIVANRALARFDNHLEQTLFVFDLAGTSVHAHEVLVPPAVQAYPMDVAALTRHYDPDYVDSLYPDKLTLTDDPAVVAELRRAWWAAVTTHPGAYLAHRLAFYQRMVGLAPQVWFAYHQGIEKNDLGIAYPTSTLQNLLGCAFWVLKFTPAYRPVFYLLGLVAALWVALRGLRRRAPLAGAGVAVALSGLLYAAPNPVLGIAADLRYHLWSMVAAMIGGALMLAAARSPEAPATAEAEPALQPIAG